MDEDIPSIAHHPIFGYQELWDRGLSPRVGELLQRLNMHWSRAATDDPGSSVGHDEAVIDNNIALLGQMNVFVNDSGAKLSILFIPFQDLLVASTAGDVPTGKDAVEHWAKTHCVPFVDLGPAMAQYPLNTVALRDHRHFNVRGNRQIATQIEAHWTQLSGAGPCELQ
jgi:hypothetical protein